MSYSIYKGMAELAIPHSWNNPQCRHWVNRILKSNPHAGHSSLNLTSPCWDERIRRNNPTEADDLLFGLEAYLQRMRQLGVKTWNHEGLQNSTLYIGGVP